MMALQTAKGRIGFLRLLTNHQNINGLNKMNLFSCSPGSQRSEVGFPGLKPVPSGVSEGELVSLPFQRPGAACIPGLAAPPLSSEGISASNMTAPSPTLLPPSDKDGDDHIQIHPCSPISASQGL